MLEKDLQKQVLDYLAYKKGKFWRVNSGAVTANYKGKDRFFKFNSIVGCSDIVGILDSGKWFACELKVGKNKPTQKQKDFIDLINYWGGVGIIAYCLEDVQEVFKKYVK